MHFYELHEGDNDVFADLLLAREDEMEPEEFFELVQSIRRRVLEGFEQNTLVEAIAEELERDHDFIAITEDRLTAAVNVSRDEEENFLADLEAPDEGVDYATILADLEAGGRQN
jgi:spore maturation protein CgeB